MQTSECAVCGGELGDGPPRMAELGDGDSFVPVCPRCYAKTPHELACANHWHCDPILAAHACDAPDRSSACPTCGCPPTIEAIS